MARDKGLKTNKKKPKLVQSTFLFGRLGSVTCPECGFEFITSMKESREQHDTFHNQKISGLKISKTAFSKLKFNGKKVQYTKTGWKNEKIECFILSCDDKQIVKLVSDMLKIVNQQWLNNKERSSNNWKTRPVDSKVVLLTSHESSTDVYRIIGITTTDPPPKSSSCLKGFHMNITTSTIDTTKPDLKLQFGVSRIFVSQNYRRHYLAEFMLDSLIEFGVPGKKLTPWQIGFSQPSNAGGRLLQHWISSRGECTATTVPVYHE